MVKSLLITSLFLGNVLFVQTRFLKPYFFFVCFLMNITKDAFQIVARCDVILQIFAQIRFRSV